MSIDRINLGAPIATICERLGIEAAFVRELTIRPTQATVTLFEQDAVGRKNIDPDTGDVAIKTIIFEVRT